jgi:ElaB/YqjD/DUF883 family membrane-anchored ribosome-binding protein
MEKVRTCTHATCDGPCRRPVKNPTPKNAKRKPYPNHLKNPSIKMNKINGQSIVVCQGAGMLNQLNAAQVAHMGKIRQFWLDHIFSCKKSLNREKAKASIDWLYKFCGLQSPVVVFVDSPMACQYAAAYCKAYISLFQKKFETLLAQPASGSKGRKKKERQVKEQVLQRVRWQVWQVGRQIREQVWQQVEQVERQVREQVWQQVKEQIERQVEQVRWQVGRQVRQQVWRQVEQRYFNYEDFSSYGNISDLGWVAFYDFFAQIGMAKNSDFEHFKNLLLSGIYDMIQLNGFCIVSNLPTKIVRNASGRLHNPSGPAIEFADGYKQYFINGRALPEWIWEKSAAGEITKAMFLEEKNSDIKGGIYEVLGQKKMLELLGAVTIDEQVITHRNGDLETVTLLKTKERFKEIGNQPFAWVKMICPSTGTQYLQGVEPHHTSALEAIASLSRFNASEYSFDYRS